MQSFVRVTRICYHILKKKPETTDSRLRYMIDKLHHQQVLLLKIPNHTHVERLNKSALEPSC